MYSTRSPSGAERTWATTPAPAAARIGSGADTVSPDARNRVAKALAAASAGEVARFGFRGSSRPSSTQSAEVRLTMPSATYVGSHLVFTAGPVNKVAS